MANKKQHAVVVCVEKRGIKCLANLRLLEPATVGTASLEGGAHLAF